MLNKSSKEITKRSLNVIGDSSKKSKVQTSLLSHFTIDITPRPAAYPSIDAKYESFQNRTDEMNISDSENFSMEESLIDQEMCKLELEFIHESWLSLLKCEFTKPYFKNLKNFLKSEIQKGVKIFPPSDRIYYWSQLCQFQSTKVVIIGQDPYHDDGQAMGLCFSVPKSLKIPPSLVNIFKEMTNDLPEFKIPGHGDLTEWAHQGVLLLNTSLTVRAHEAASHSGKGWEQFTDSVIRIINDQRNNIVFILWGNHAQKKASMIDKSRHLILMGVHPSPLSASRGFFGCKHFSKTNAYLRDHDIEPINWQITPK